MLARPAPRETYGLPNSHFLQQFALASIPDHGVYIGHQSGSIFSDHGPGHIFPNCNLGQLWLYGACGTKDDAIHQPEPASLLAPPR